MQQYQLNKEEILTLTDTHFYIPKLKYYSTLDYIPLTDIKNWLNSPRQSNKKNTIAKWINSVEKYLNILSLLGLSHQIIWVSDIMQLIYSSSLVTEEKLSKQETIIRISHYLQNAKVISPDSLFFLTFVKSFLGLITRDFYQYFYRINYLDYTDKSYFYKMFYYFSLNDFELSNVTINTNYRFIKKCVNTWYTITENTDIDLLKYYLNEYLFINCNQQLLEFIITPESLSNYKSIKINEFTQWCEGILGVSINTEFSVAKKHYLELIRVNHPDKHLDNFDYYSQKTAEINLAWNEWKNFNNESQTY